MSEFNVPVPHPVPSELHRRRPQNRPPRELQKLVLLPRLRVPQAHEGEVRSQPAADPHGRLCTALSRRTSTLKPTVPSTATATSSRANGPTGLASPPNPPLFCDNPANFSACLSSPSEMSSTASNSPSPILTPTHAISNI